MLTSRNNFHLKNLFHFNFLNKKSSSLRKIVMKKQKKKTHKMYFVATLFAQTNRNTHTSNHTHTKGDKKHGLKTWKTHTKITWVRHKLCLFTFFPCSIACLSWAAWVEKKNCKHRKNNFFCPILNLNLSIPIETNCDYDMEDPRYLFFTFYP